MDTVLEALVDFVAGADFAAMPESAVRRVARHTLDAVGCGAGGFGSAPAGIARRIARRTNAGWTASVYGEAAPASLAQAALANATANRYLDFNDFGVSGHPSDMIPALLGTVEATAASGADAVLAIHIAYEVATRLAEGVPADGGWDQGLYCAFGIAAGQAKILGLSREQIAHALSLAAVSSVPLRVTRFGELSEWKAAATGFAAASATLAVELAQAGMSGPSEPFEGKDGLLERVWPTFDLDLGPRSETAIERASLKRHPACYWGQVPIDLALEIRDQVDIAGIAEIEVLTCESAWRSIGGGRGDVAEKWRPPTRETADHSMPYLMAIALLDGGLPEAAFTPERLRDPEVLSMVDRISVIESPALSDQATRDTCPTQMTAHMHGGRELKVTADLPRGHHANPMGDDEVSEKFRLLAERALSSAEAAELADLLWGLSDLPDLAAVARLFRSFRTL